jgi:hypothetical protein
LNNILNQKMKPYLMPKFVGFMALWFLLILGGCQDPPTADLNTAKANLDKAAKTGALRYSEKSYRQAEKLMKSGWMEMAYQNGKFAPFRNYRKADSLLTLANKTALLSLTETDSLIHALDSLSRNELRQINTDLASWRNSLDGSLVIFEAERFWSMAELSSKTSEKFIAQGEYEEARREISKARYNLSRLSTTLDDYSSDTAQKTATWRRWVQETLDETKSRNCHGLIVDKSAHKTYLVRAGNLIKTYECELGYNSAQQKLFAGDGATPEGRYFVTQVKVNGNSRFYKALLINYPNENDRHRFAQNKSKGIISSRAGIGRLIEIHGDGGRNEDWTDGCVAVTNHIMDEIVAVVGAGAPVTIVRRSDRWP